MDKTQLQSEREPLEKTLQELQAQAQQLNDAMQRNQAAQLQHQGALMLIDKLLNAGEPAPETPPAPKPPPNRAARRAKN